ncbi:unnamed protein product [Rhizoctonia solani]|uniref:Uncharacterized protein n=1 Tax=Rhizoctonia solani TaxID=456999 RepID=A0A8H3I334_9AGAM|nr:unnamed protein product [Rhizoctonia solani]
MGVSNGPEICVGASFKGYLATLLVPCILLVLGSYIFVAAMAYVYHKSKGLDAVSEPPVEDAGIQEIPSCDKFISGAPLPTPEEVLESTLKQYGHLSDSDKVETTSQSPPRPNLEPKAITLDQKSLKNTVRRDVAIMFRGTVPDSWVAEQHGPRETRSAPWTSSAHTTAMNVIEVGTPIVRIPTRSLTASSIPIQRNDILWHPIGVGVAVRPGMMLQTTARNRPALITTNTHHLAAMQHQCFSSSPLRYNYTITSPRPPQLRVQVPASPTLPMGMPRKNVWAPSG